MSKSNSTPKKSPKVRILERVQSTITAMDHTLPTDEFAEQLNAKLEEMKTTVPRATQGDTVLKDEDGNVVAIYCSYQKKWEPVEAEVTVFEDEEGNETTEIATLFGKAKTPIGYARMCKEGAKNLNSSARAVRQARDEITENWLKGEISEDEAKKALTELEEEAAEEHKPREDGIGFDTKEEAAQVLLSY